MNKISFYEQVGIIIPGSVLLFGLSFYFAEIRDYLGKDSVSVGGLGIFLVIAYAAGNLLAALAGIISDFYWRMLGGMPSDWIIGPNPALISKSQIKRIQDLIPVKLNIHVKPLTEIERQEWFPIFRQIYSEVERNGKPERADIFNGIYGLNRGLFAATLSLTALTFAHPDGNWKVSIVLAASSALYFRRMHLFGVHYAREVFSQFLLLGSSPSAKTGPSA